MKCLVNHIIEKSNTITVAYCKSKHNNSNCIIKISTKDIALAECPKHYEIQNEANILTTLKHASIIQLYQTISSDTQLISIYEPAEGVPLTKLLMVYKVVPSWLIQSIMIQLVDWLKYLHTSGYVYRDIKPTNIIIDKELKIRVIDYGFTKKIDKARTATVCGTYHAMAPEIVAIYLGLNKTGYDYSADYYSLGVLLYELLVGSAPYGYFIAGMDIGKYMLELYNKQKAHSYKELVSDKAFSSLFRSLMECDPAMRINYSGVHGHEFMKLSYETNFNQREEITDYIELTGLTKQAEKETPSAFDIF